ncbi:hypothetical protein [uncultured Streptomyces sp.]|uniref:hypothetical protein n=1 Tax=uncultured Streptomyces sp. TaxID=174707 RepID=UPI002620C240|nr:hypothetical protein [uncultured Streptomyces sp.]
MKFTLLKRFACVAGASSLIAGTMFLTTGTAHASESGSPSGVTCAVTLETQFSPGLTFTEQSTTLSFDARYRTCVSDDPTLTSGTRTASSTVVRSCNSLAGTSSGTYTISWNNGQSSTINYSRSATYVAGQAVQVDTGIVASGEFSGRNYLYETVGPQPNLLRCATPGGVTSLTSVGTVIIL